MKTPNTLIDERQLRRITESQALLSRFRDSGLSPYHFALETGVPASRIYRLEAREAAGGLTGFADGRAKNGRKSSVSPEAVLWTLGYLAEHRRGTLTGAWRNLRQVCEVREWRYPSYAQLARAVRMLPADIRAHMVQGSRHHFESWGLVKRVEVETPNLCWQVDATEIPVWVLDPVTGKTFKPWAIGMIDCATRVVMGYHVMPAAPNTGDLVLALRSAILPKDDPRFPFFGRPQAVQSDNGSIFKSADFLDALLKLGVVHRPIENDCPSANGKIERFFRTIHDGFARNLIQFAEQHRALQTARAMPLPFPLLARQAEAFLVEYHLRKHKTLGISPWEAWQNGLADACGFNFDRGEVIDACKIRLERRVARDGIEMGAGVHFSAPELAGLVGATVTLRLSPDRTETAIPCFYRGELIAELRRVEGDDALSQAIRSARLERAKEVARLRKSLLKAAARISPNQPTALPPGMPITLGDETAAGEGEAEGTQGLEIPDLGREEDEE